MLSTKESFAHRLLLDLRYRLARTRHPRRTLGPPIFVVGAPHSGTSITTALLSEHPDIFTISGETRMFTRQSPELEAFQFDKMTFCAGRVRWLEKTPEHVMYLRELFRLFPRAQVLVLLRDGRDVATSIYHRTGNLEAGIATWLEANRQAEAFIGDPRIFRLKYEDLITKLEETLRALCLFLNLPFETRMLEHHRTQRYYYADTIRQPASVTGADHGVHRNWQINQPIFDGRGKWKTITEEQKALIKALAGAELQKYGYVPDAQW